MAKKSPEEILAAAKEKLATATTSSYRKGAYA
jgi:hypothetical protein